MISGEFREMVQRKAWDGVDRELGRLAEQAYAGALPMEVLDVHEEYAIAHGHNVRSGFYWRHDDLKVLKGFEVISVHLTQDQHKVTIFGRGEWQDKTVAVELKADPDCCEDMWWNHASGMEALAPGCVIREARIIRAYDEGLTVTRQEADNLSGLRLWTDRGMADFEMRASSNGYYSGSLHVVVVFCALAPTDRIVTEDW